MSCLNKLLSAFSHLQFVQTLWEPLKVSDFKILIIPESHWKSCGIVQNATNAEKIQEEKSIWGLDRGKVKTDFFSSDAYLSEMTQWMEEDLIASLQSILRKGQVYVD